MNHLAIPVSDPERSRRFYEAYFGFGARPPRVYDDGVVFVYDDRGFALALGPYGAGEPPAWLHFGRGLADRAAVLALRDRFAADGLAIHEFLDEPEYLSVKVRDPDGYIVEAYWEPA
jgi:catechol 2,3-dioxygenase-like lactoylglutathione lyase family enzyme